MAPVPSDGGGGRRVGPLRQFFVNSELRGNTSGKDLAKLNSPLVEAIDSPDHALHENQVFIHGEDLTKG